MWKKHERKMEYDDHLLDVNLEREDVSKEEKSLEGRELDISDQDTERKKVDNNACAYLKR